MAWKSERKRSRVAGGQRRTALDITVKEEDDEDFGGVATGKLVKKEDGEMLCG